MVKFYCEYCDKYTPVIIDPFLSTDSLNGESIWGDIICAIKGCNSVTTITADEPGIYEFIKVSELNDRQQ